MNDQKEFYTAQEAADREGVTQKTIYNWIKAGLRTSVVPRHGRYVQMVIDPDDLAEFLHESIIKAEKESQ